MENCDLKKNIELIGLSKQIMLIGNAAIRNVQKENRKSGIPIVYSIDGKIIYELPDGRMTMNCNL